MFPDGHEGIPGNPYALIKKGLIIDIFYAQLDSKERIAERLSSYEYDSCISCTEYGQELFIGDSITKEGHLRAASLYPSWTWSSDLQRWESPVGSSPQDGKNWVWDEESLSWIVCVTKLTRKAKRAARKSKANDCCSGTNKILQRR